MSLTVGELEQVRGVVVGAIQELVLPRFDEHDKRFKELENDVAEIKKDVRILKDKMQEVKVDIHTLQGDVREVKDSLYRLEGRVEALEADAKELYAMVVAQKPAYSDKRFAKLSVEQKILKMYEDVKLLAREAGVTLPR